MARVQASQPIERPAGQLFAHARDAVAHAQSETAQFDVEQTGERAVGLRTAFGGGIRFLGRGIDWAPERRIGLASAAMKGVAGRQRWQAP